MNAYFAKQKAWKININPKTKPSWYNFNIYNNYSLRKANFIRYDKFFTTHETVEVVAANITCGHAPVNKRGKRLHFQRCPHDNQQISILEVLKNKDQKWQLFIIITQNMLYRLHQFDTFHNGERYRQ